MPSLSAALDYTRDKRPAILSVRSSFKRQTVELGPHGEILPKADIFDEVVPAIEEAGLDCEVVGGGRIQHEASKRKIVIFGYSQGYGQADHRLAAQIISKKYPSYDNISWNNEGY